MAVTANWVKPSVDRTLRLLHNPGPDFLARLGMEGPRRGEDRFDRTQEYAADRRNESYDRLRYATREVLTLDPLPCWRHLSPEARQKRAASLVAEIEAQAAVHREQTGIQPLGPAAILSQDPLSRPRHVKRSPAPRFHAASKAIRRERYDRYREFVAAFRDAAALLRKGDRSAVFPVGSFPPALPFVGG